MNGRPARRAIALAILCLLSIALPASLLAGPFQIARIHYDGGGDWYSDPSSLPNLLEAVHRQLGIEVAGEEKQVRLTDEDLFSHPYLYLTGHGNLRFSEEDAVRLRDYLEGGGFLHVDDNYGLDEAFRREIANVFPTRELVEVPFSHPVYHMVHGFPQGPPKVHEHDGHPPRGYGIFVEGRLVLYYTWEADLGDGWEDPEVHEVPEEVRRRALEMGVNLVAWVLAGMPEAL
jgi:hypothetical protein